ncbi:MAG: hypothetical protein ACYST2_03745 [Planctomycetota bacterium]
MNSVKERNPELNEIIADVDCAKDFECCKSDFVNLCRIKINERDSFIECLEESSDSCTFSLPCVEKRYCLCPVRIHIARTLKK